MKRTLVVLFFGLCVGSANASVYKLDETHLNQLFEESTDVSSMLNTVVFPFAGSQMSVAEDGGMDKQTIAVIVIVAQYFLTAGVLSIIPIHRIILGCDGQTVKIVALYCVTLGGCGILPIVDAIFLLIDDTKQKYIENPKFLMWTKS